MQALAVYGRTRIAQHRRRFRLSCTCRRSHTCLVAAPDTLTGQPSFLQLPATAVWAASATCGPDMAAAAAAAGQLAAMTHVQVGRWTPVSFA